MSTPGAAALERLRARLAGHGLDLDKLPLAAGQAVLSGSAVWHAVCDSKEWQPGDLDVFCRPSALPALRKFLFDAGYRVVLGVSGAPSATTKHSITETWDRPTRGLLIDTYPCVVVEEDYSAVGIGPPAVEMRGVCAAFPVFDIQLCVIPGPEKPLIDFNVDVLEVWYDGHAFCASTSWQQVLVGTGKLKENVWKLDDRTLERVLRRFIVKWQTRGLVLQGEHWERYSSEILRLPAIPPPTGPRTKKRMHVDDLADAMEKLGLEDSKVDDLTAGTVVSAFKIALEQMASFDGSKSSIDPLYASMIAVLQAIGKLDSRLAAPDTPKTKTVRSSSAPSSR